MMSCIIRQFEEEMELHLKQAEKYAEFVESKKKRGSLVLLLWAKKIIEMV